MVPAVLVLASGASGSAFGSWKKGSDGASFRFRFSSWATCFASTMSEVSKKGWREGVGD